MSSAAPPCWVAERSQRLWTPDARTLERSPGWRPLQRGVGRHPGGDAARLIRGGVVETPLWSALGRVREPIDVCPEGANGADLTFRVVNAFFVWAAEDLWSHCDRADLVHAKEVENLAADLWVLANVAGL